MRSSASPLNRLFARGLLALALLFAQQHAALHWLSHAIDATHQKAPAPGSDEPCDQCLTLSALDAANVGSAVALLPVTAQPVLCALPASTDSPAALRLAFRSRAPPILV